MPPIDPASQSSREYPARPIVGVAGLVLDRGRALLIRRARPPLQGAWNLPGGALRTGERITDGILREVLEETGLHVVPVRHIATLDRILPDASGRVQFHYVLVDWLCSLVPGQPAPVAASDAAAVGWFTRAALRTLPGLDDTARTLIEQTMDSENAEPS